LAYPLIHADEAQIKAHQAYNNIIVAYSEDQGLFASSAAILKQSKQWPKDVESFRTSVEALRPLFEEKLGTILPKLKKKIYQVSTYV
jgi:hypothetical protein